MRTASLVKMLRCAARPALVLRLDPRGDRSPGGSGVPRHRALGQRAVDLAVAAALLAITVPVLALVALAVRLESPGPVLLREPHLGEGGQVFHLLTFRCTGPAGVGQPAMTRVGGFIHRPRIDQLPVLFNLLRGDMTLVGPAPVPLGASGGSGGMPARRPGVTGWAALN